MMLGSVWPVFDIYRTKLKVLLFAEECRNEHGDHQYVLCCIDTVYVVSLGNE